jgi:hypothetical protein
LEIQQGSVNIMSKPKDLAFLTRALADVIGKSGAISRLEFEFHPDHFKEFAGDGGWDGGNIYTYRFGFQQLPERGGDPAQDEVAQ